jgi:hypothetical protein
LILESEGYVEALPTTRARCRDLFNTIKADLMDCVSDDIALVLAHAGVDDATVPFACTWHFEITSSDDRACPRLELPPGEQDDLVRRWSGYRPRWCTDPSGAVRARWATYLEHGRPIIVVADAFHLPWLPYAGHEHMDHGFVVESITGDVLEIADPYDNVTRWGRARPTAMTIDFEELRPALRDDVAWAVLERSGDPEENEPIDYVLANAESILRSERNRVADHFVQGHNSLDQMAVESLSLQTWLLARSRALHAWWLGNIAEGNSPVSQALVDRFAGEIVPGWQRASEAAYIALRRVKAGKAAAPAVLDAVAACCHREAELAADLLAAARE